MSAIQTVPTPPSVPFLITYKWTFDENLPTADRDKDLNSAMEYRFPATSFLSIVWDRKAPKEVRGKAYCDYAFSYLGGMIGFTFALPWRIVRFALRFFALIVAALCCCSCCDWQSLSDRAIVLGITGAKILSAVIGIICPPAAYQIEDFLDRKMPLSDYTYFIRMSPIITDVSEAYTILNLPFGSSREAVNDAYKTLILKYHPDKGGSKEKFQELKNAYDLLELYFNYLDDY